MCPVGSVVLALRDLICKDLHALFPCGALVRVFGQLTVRPTVGPSLVEELVAAVEVQLLLVQVLVVHGLGVLALVVF
eukprot:CAMPEP_0195036210 /NCGR_PEP_ID=MMETSP0326_2-20130528/71959_1 /TAXON_ID=2866 ORGANISM="Crypthecodinium cohnii, Strain Seligo" /NCGR_SAMPLE_ID=MMETSP0326_2 /ASSEMBLY_ACC=CAM_ASM_000348 /LENGTH=76 /DNA_ID=CAMNT_0040061713 /DNA_START=186 /DNA_END=416 /DNA_ORIENTATION=+